MQGPLVAMAAAILFGISSPIAKSLLGDLSPWLLAGLLYLGSGIGMALIQLSRLRAGTFRISASDLPWLGWVTFFGGIAGPVLLMYGLAQTAASTASLLLNLEGVLTAILAWVVFREHYSARIAIGMIVITIGGALLAGASRFEAGGLSGPILVAAACLCWAIDNNLTRKISLNDAIFLTMVKSLVAGSTNLLIALALGATLPSGGVLVASLSIGFVCYGLSIVCFILALRSLGASRTGAYFSMAPFIGASVAVLFLGDPITTNLLMAAALMGIGIYLHLTESHEHEHVHEPIVHEHAHVHDEHHQHEHESDVALGEPHTHRHAHERLSHRHPHVPDMHHNHQH